LPALQINQDGVDSQGKFHSGGRVGHDDSCAAIAAASADGSSSSNNDDRQQLMQKDNPCQIWARRISSGGVALVLCVTSFTPCTLSPPPAL
jgi:hypothetical protein